MLSAILLGGGGDHDDKNDEGEESDNSRLSESENLDEEGLRDIIIFG